jgi:hypothetical protein
MYPEKYTTQIRLHGCQALDLRIRNNIDSDCATHNGFHK